MSVRGDGVTSRIAGFMAITSVRAFGTMGAQTRTRNLSFGIPTLMVFRVSRSRGITGMHNSISSIVNSQRTWRINRSTCRSHPTLKCGNGAGVITSIMITVRGETLIGSGIICKRPRDRRNQIRSMRRGHLPANGILNDQCHRCFHSCRFQNQGFQHTEYPRMGARCDGLERGTRIPTSYTSAQRKIPNTRAINHRVPLRLENWIVPRDIIGGSTKSVGKIQ